MAGIPIARRSTDRAILESGKGTPRTSIEVKGQQQQQLLLQNKGMEKRNGKDESSSSSEEAESDSSDTEALLNKAKETVRGSTKHNDQKNKTKKEGTEKKKKANPELGSDLDLEQQLQDEGYEPPLMETFPQVLGFFGWQAGTFVMGLSLGMFLSGIIPGYEHANVGIKSHWWQNDVKKPFFQPPDAILGPIWISTLSLAAMGAWLVWRYGGWKYNKLALSMYVTNLFFFQAWLCLFFFMQQVSASLFFTTAGWGIMLFCVICFYRRSRLACFMLLFSFLWKSFIVIDLVVIWVLNNDELP